ncbi:MAG: hypothetical protein ACXWP5_05290 [Bdellovibrionota bacterium]
MGSALEHGGSTRDGRRKITRPIDLKRPLHVVMRATRARGPWSLLHRRHKSLVHVIVLKAADRYRIRIHSYANVGNHLHLHVQARTRAEFQNFLRVAAGKIATTVTGARKGFAVGKFWDKLAYTRVVRWGRDFAAVQTYLIKNLLEGLGAASRHENDRIFSRAGPKR